MNKKIIALLLTLCMILSTGSVFAEEETVDLEKIEEILDVIEYNYKYDVSKKELIDGAYRGILNVLDKYSQYYTKEEYQNFFDSLSGSIIGIGIFIEEEDGFVRIISPIEGSPAEKAGLKSGDVITHIDGVDILETSYENAINMIQGEVGTQVKIRYRRGNVSNEIAIIRESITIPDVRYEMLDNNIGYLRIIQFGEDVSNEVDKAIEMLRKEGMTSIIVDLRNNPGGYLDEVIEISDWFVDKNDEIVTVDYKNFKDSVYKGEKDPLNIPAVVIVNSASASASEILAAAIKYNDKGIILGETTFGKGTVQSMLLVTGRSGMKLTTAEYFSVNSIKVNGVGVVPDVILPSLTTDEVNSINTFAPMVDNEVSHFGVTSLDVYGAQQRLKLLGYDIDLNGYYDTKTSSAINDFQERHELVQKYALYPETKSKLNSIVSSYLNDDAQLNKAIEILTSK